METLGLDVGGTKDLELLVNILWQSVKAMKAVADNTDLHLKSARERIEDLESDIAVKQHIIDKQHEEILELQKPKVAKRK